MVPVYVFDRSTRKHHRLHMGTRPGTVQTRYTGRRPHGPNHNGKTNLFVKAEWWS
jgi:hypothetical protein